MVKFVELWPWIGLAVGGDAVRLPFHPAGQTSLGKHAALSVHYHIMPTMLAAVSANAAAYQTSGTAGLVYTPVLLFGLIACAGGTGNTLSLAFFGTRAKSEQLRAVGKAGLIPGIFNINEPILFGFPVIMNPLFLVPFLFAPLFNATLAWYLTDWGWLDRFVAILPWSMPSPIGAAWSANGSWRTALMSLFAFTNAWIIYYPFFKVHERLLLENKRAVMQKKGY